MRRRSFMHRAAIALAGVAAGAYAQQRSTAPRIALLLPAASPNETALREALRDLGYAEGSKIAIDRRSADGDFERLPALARELVATKPDVVVAFLTQASIAARQATTAIPIVMVGVADPVASGLVASLARPGENITGTAGQSSTVIGKQLDLIRELRPDATKITALWNPANAVFQQQSVRAAQDGARRLRMNLTLVEARTPSEIDVALERLGSERPDAVLVLADPSFGASARRISESLLKHRIVAVSGGLGYVEVGMLAVYGPDLAASARRAAAYVDRILRGAKPADLPIELETKFQLVINLKTAKALGLAIPQALLLRADEVIR